MEDTVSMLRRTIKVLEKPEASLLQVKRASDLTSTFSLMVQASLIDTSDAAKLSAFVQASQAAEATAAYGDEDSEDLGSPSADAFESKAIGVVGTMQDLLDKAETQLDATRRKETAAQNNFAMLQQSLQNEIKLAAKELDAAKSGISAAKEAKSEAQGELEGVIKELQGDTKTKSELHHDCVTKAQNFEIETKDRDAEIAVLAKAKDIIRENVKTAALNQVSFVQVASYLKPHSFDPNFQVVRVVRELGHKAGSKMLLQLASNMAKTLRSTSGGDGLDKVRQMISDMIARLEEEVSETARKKAYCDKELAESKEKNVDTQDEVEELGTRIEKMTGKSKRLEEDVKELKIEELLLTKSSAEMQVLYRKDRALYEETKGTVEQALRGVQTAIKVLKDYYSNNDSASAGGAANNIIGLLEATETKLNSWLMDVKADEQMLDRNFKSFVQENEVELTTKETEEKYKIKIDKKVDAKAAESRSDKDTMEQELDAVAKYYARLKKECIAKPDTFEERAKRRQAEIDGLQAALEVLSSSASSASFLQRGTSHRTLRGGALALNWPRRQVTARAEAAAVAP